MFEDVEVCLARGKLYYYVKKSRNTVACSMMVVIRGLPDNTGVIEIHNVQTKPDFRRKGHASELLSALKVSFAGSIKYIYTSYADSTIAGRKLMQANGFKIRDKKLVWENLDVKPLVEMKTEQKKPPLVLTPEQFNVRQNLGQSLRSQLGVIHGVPIVGAPGAVSGVGSDAGDRPLPAVLGASVQGSGVGDPDGGSASDGSGDDRGGEREDPADAGRGDQPGDPEGSAA